MSSYAKHAPKHRKPASSRAPRVALRTSLRVSSMAVVATGLAVGGGALSLSADGGDKSAGRSGTLTPQSAQVTATDSSDPAQFSAPPAERDAVVSRSDRRAPADQLKEDSLSLGNGNAMTRTEDLSDEDPRTIAAALLAEFGFSQDQFGCLDSLWERESHWNVYADNPTSSAYGIPQALPGSKMSSAGADWADNPVTQIRWGLGYIQDRYGSPCGAWGHSESHGWY